MCECVHVVRIHVRERERNISSWPYDYMCMHQKMRFEIFRFFLLWYMIRIRTKGEFLDFYHNFSSFLISLPSWMEAALRIYGLNTLIRRPRRWSGAEREREMESGDITAWCSSPRIWQSWVLISVFTAGSKLYPETGKWQEVKMRIYQIATVKIFRT